MPGRERRTGLLRYVLEGALAGVAIEECVVAGVNVDVLPVDFREYVAVHHHEPLPAAVREVQEGATPVDETRVSRQPRGHRNVVKLAVARVAIEQRGLVGEVRAENVEPAVPVIVRRGKPHAGQLAAVLIESHSPHDGLFREGAVTLVDEERRGRLIPNHVNVRPPVVVDVLGQDGERVVAGRPGDPGLHRHVFKRPVALVVVQQVGFEREPTGSAVDRHPAVEAVGIGARLRRRGEVELQVVGDEQVQVSVAIVVEERAARVVAGSVLSKMSLGRDVLEPFAVHVAVETVLTPVSDEQVGVSVVVIVARADTLGPAG